jgi:hypothetical protein
VVLPKFLDSLTTLQNKSQYVPLVLPVLVATSVSKALTASMKILMKQRTIFSIAETVPLLKITSVHAAMTISALLVMPMA